MLVLFLFAAASAVLLPRKEAPEFTAKAVVGEQFQELSLADYRGKYVVLLFYPFDFTFVCPTELISFSDAKEQFDEINTVVLGISCDSLHSHLAWIRTDRADGGVGKLTYPLISDFSKKIAKKYEVLVEECGDDLNGAPLRGLYIIDGNGIIRVSQVNDAPVGRSVEEVIRLVKGYQYTDANPEEVCPASWQPGQNTIVPDHDRKTEYFKGKYGEGEL